MNVILNFRTNKLITFYPWSISNKRRIRTENYYVRKKSTIIIVCVIADNIHLFMRMCCIYSLTRIH